jgi:branched-chain amino acid transport system ATP-binding protein/branched-chain amino acid transport system permease protein
MTARSTVLGFILLAALLVAVPLTAHNEYELRLFMLFLVYAIIALGLNILVGLAGLISLGQAGLFALGAYSGAVLATRFGFGLVAASIAGIAITTVFGVLLAYPTVRVRGVYLAVITIAFGLIVENAAIEWQGLTGGPMGITNIPKPHLLGMRLSGFAYFAVLAVVLFATAVGTHNMKNSRYGRAMLAVAQSETAARSLGINATAVRTLAFAISAATAGLAGALYSFLNSYISPDVFTFSDSIRFLLMVIFGGAGTTTGPLLGALLLTYLPEYLQQLQYWQAFAYGFLLAAVMFVLPQGVFGTAVELVRRLRPGARTIDGARAVELAQALRSQSHSRTDLGADHRAHAGAELLAETLTVRFGGLIALDEVSMQVRPGEIHALIGPNGSGKSTLVNTITGFYQPAHGRVALDGTDLTRASPHEIARHGLARTFQNTELFGDLTVIENVMVGYDQRFRYGLFDAAIRTPRFRRGEQVCGEVAASLLGFLGLLKYAHEKARFLPFGLQRRLEVARALASGPRLLLLDEPAAGLTAKEIEELDGMIRRIASLGVSVLLIEHHIELIMAIADRVTVLDYGEVIASDVPDRIQQDARVIEAYFGAPVTAKA